MPRVSIYIRNRKNLHTLISSIAVRSCCISSSLGCFMRNILTYKAPLLGKRIKTVNPAYTSQRDHRGLPGGERKGCRFKASDGVMFDADWNAAINIALKYVQTKEAHGTKHPISFSLPLRGRLNLMGRLLSTNQSSYLFLGKPNHL